MSSIWVVLSLQARHIMTFTGSLGLPKSTGSLRTASESEGTIIINLQLNNVYDPADTGSGAYNGGFYGAQFSTAGTTIILSDTEAKVPTTPENPTPDVPDESNPKSGDTISVFVALMAVSAMGIAVVAGKKKN